MYANKISLIFTCTNFYHGQQMLVVKLLQSHLGIQLHFCLTGELYNKNILYYTNYVQLTMVVLIQT